MRFTILRQYLCNGRSILFVQRAEMATTKFGFQDVTESEKANKGALVYVHLYILNTGIRVRCTYVNVCIFYKQMSLNVDGINVFECPKARQPFCNSTVAV